MTPYLPSLSIFASPLFQKRIFIVLVLTLGWLRLPLYAQQAGKLKLTGKIVDAQQNAPLSFATIRVFKQADSSLVSGGVTDDKGNFLVELPAGSYYGLLEFMGYKPTRVAAFQISRENSPLHLGTLSLKATAKTLDEVTVQAERSAMEVGLDKKIFNVGKDLASTGRTAIDILSNVPSVAVSPDGGVSLRGSGSVRILIDGKPSGLVSFKGGAGLQQLQGSMIERIEVITNPSARYEAEGMGGIINIVLKKNQKQGINGSFDVITGYPTNLGLAANVNYRRKNLNFFVNYTLSYREAPGRNSLYQELYRNDSTFITRMNANGNLQGMNNSARAGFDYFFTPKSILTAAYTWRTSVGRRIRDLRYLDYSMSERNLNTVTQRRQDETETEPNSEYSLSYKKSFLRKEHELTADIRYLDNWEKSDQTFTQQGFMADGITPKTRNVLQRSINDETEKQWLFQLDYVHPFAKDGKLETGARSSFRTMTNNYWVREQTEKGDFVALPGLTNDFLYQENIHAAYGIYGNKINKFSYQLGLRGEWTDVTTTLKQTNQVNPRNYGNLFPSTHIGYELPKQHSIQASYSRRVRRPRYNDLSPFMTFSDNRNYYSGNPDLNPEFTDAFEVGHLKYMQNGSVSSSVYYRHTNGEVEQIRRVLPNGNSVTRPENLATEDVWGLELTGSYALYQWWKLDGNANFFRAITNGANIDASLYSDTYTWFTRLTSRFTLWKSTDMQLRGNYEAPQKTTQGNRKAVAALDFAISRDILKGNGTLTLNVTDVFNSRRYRSNTYGSNFYTYSNSQGRLRQTNLTFSYRLHQGKASGKGKKSGGEDEGEL